MSLRHPYFRVTTKAEGRSSLMGWFEHHKELGTPIIMIQEKLLRKDSRFVYSLWVIGLEAIADNLNGTGTFPNKESLPKDYVVIFEANSFISELIKWKKEN